MARSVARKGYAHVTVADVVAEAGVSRRTFYEQFADRQDCFLAAYRQGTAELLDGMIKASLEADPDGWRLRMRAGLTALCRGLAERPELARVLMVDVLGAGPEALVVREELFGGFVERLVVLAAVARQQDPSIPEPDRDLLRAVVGGIAELVQRYLVSDRADEIPSLVPALERFVGAVLLAPPARP